MIIENAHFVGLTLITVNNFLVRYKNGKSPKV